MGRFRLLACAALAVACASPAFATDGTHINQDELTAAIAAAIEQAMPEVLTTEVEREVIVKVPVEVPVPVEPEQTVNGGGSIDAQGCATPGGEVESTYTTHLGYRFKLKTDRADFRFRGDVEDKPRGSDCTEQGLTIDIAGAATFDFVGDSFLAIDIGYDEHGVTGFDADNVLVFGAVKQATAAAMIGYELDSALPGVLRVKGGWNVANGQPRFAASYALGEHLEIGLDVTGTDGADPYVDLRGCWVRGFGDGWGVEACYEHSNGFEHLPDPFGGRADAPAANEANGLVFSVTRAL